MKFKPLIDEEDERRRASAAAKLRALDEAIAKRKAEEDRCIALAVYFAIQPMHELCKQNPRLLHACWPSCKCGSYA